MPVLGGRDLRTSAASLAANSLSSLTSQVVPIVATLMALPVLMARLGAERFGVLAVFWTVLAYFGASDLGLGYVVTRMTAVRLGAGDRAGVPEVFWTCAALLSVIGGALTLLFVAIVPWLSSSGLSLPDSLREETRLALWILAVGLPLSIVSTVCRGVLEAYQAFARRNAITLANALLTLAAPLLVSFVTTRLDVIALVLALSRVLVCGWFVGACAVVEPRLSEGVRARYATLREAGRLASWMTVLTIAGPVLLYSDRAMLAGIVSVAIAGRYFVVYELSTRLLIAAGAMTVVLMPAVAETLHADASRAWRLFGVCLKTGLLTMFALTFTGAALAPVALEVWLGKEVAAATAPTLRILLVGVLFNAVGVVSLSMVLGAGLPRMAGRLQLAELVVYLPAAWWCIERWGLPGAAAAYAGRAAVDALALLWTCGYVRPVEGQEPRRAVYFLLCGAALVCGWQWMWPGLWQFGYLLVGLVGFCFACGRWLFSSRERSAVRANVWSAVGPAGAA